MKVQCVRVLKHSQGTLPIHKLHDGIQLLLGTKQDKSHKTLHRCHTPRPTFLSDGPKEILWMAPNC